MSGFFDVGLTKAENRYPEVDYYKDFDYSDFDVFRSTLKHRLKSMGVQDFIDWVSVEPIYSKIEKKLYLCGFLKHITVETNVVLPEWVFKYDNTKLEKVLLPKGVLDYTIRVGDYSWFNETMENSIPEFLDYNIAEVTLTDIA